MDRKKLLPSTIITSVVRLEYGKFTATATVLNLEDDNQLILTVRHIFVNGEKDGDKIGFAISNADATIKGCGNLYFGDNGADIAIIRTNKIVGIAEASIRDVDTEKGDVFISDDFYIIGFPFVMGNNIYSGALKIPNTSFPAGLVKHGYISGVEYSGGVRKYYLDLHNNIGFSGSPICYYMDGKYKIIGVVCGYHYDMFKSGINPNSNSGIAYGTSAEHIKGIFDRFQ